MVPILANLPILGRFLRVGCSRSFREKTTFVAQNKKNMVNVIVLCIELLLDIVGLVLGILVYSRSSDNNGLTKAWGVLAITLSLLLLCDNLEWMWIFSRGGEETIPRFTEVPMNPSFDMAYCPGDCLFSVLFYFSYSLIETGMDDFFKSRQFMYPYFADYMYSLLL